MQQRLADMQQAMEAERKMAAKEREKMERLEKAVETERKVAAEEAVRVMAEEKDRVRRLEEKVNCLEKELTIAKEVMDDTTDWIVAGVRVLLPFLTSLLSLFLVSKRWRSPTSNKIAHPPRSCAGPVGIPHRTN